MSRRLIKSPSIFYLTLYSVLPGIIFLFTQVSINSVYSVSILFLIAVTFGLLYVLVRYRVDQTRRRYAAVEWFFSLLIAFFLSFYIRSNIHVINMVLISIHNYLFGVVVRRISDSISYRSIRKLKSSWFVLISVYLIFSPVDLKIVPESSHIKLSNLTESLEINDQGNASLRLTGDLDVDTGAVYILNVRSRTEPDSGQKHGPKHGNDPKVYIDNKPLLSSYNFKEVTIPAGNHELVLEDDFRLNESIRENWEEYEEGYWEQYVREAVASKPIHFQISIYKDYVKTNQRELLFRGGGASKLYPDLTETYISRSYELEEIVKASK